MITPLQRPLKVMLVTEMKLMWLMPDLIYFPNLSNTKIANVANFLRYGKTRFGKVYDAEVVVDYD